MRIVLMTLYKQALRRASRAMFNARLIALAIDVDLPHCDAPHRRKPAKMLQPRHAQAKRPPGAAFGTTTAAANRSVGETDVRPDAVDRLRGRRPEIPARPEQVDLHALAAGPGVPKFLRVEGALGGARQLVERNAQMPAENHRQNVARHGLAATHRGGEGRGQNLAAR